MSVPPADPPADTPRGWRWWLLVSLGGLLVVLVVLWNTSVTVRCSMIEVRRSVVDAWPFQVTDDGPLGLDRLILDDVAVVARVQASDSAWIDGPGWDSCLRAMEFEVREILWSVDELPLPLGVENVPSLPDEGTVILLADTRGDVGEFFVFFSHREADFSGAPTDWWARLVFDGDQQVSAGLDEAAEFELAAMSRIEEVEAGNVEVLVEYRQELLEVDRARFAEQPIWEVGPRTEALLRYRGVAVRDYLGAPQLDIWLEWDPVDRHLGWTRSHLPEGAADALDIEWGNGEVVVVHHTLTSESVTSVGLLSSIGLTGPESLVAGGGEVSVRGQYARATPLTLVVFDPEGDIAIYYHVPESMLRALDDGIAVAVDLDLGGAENWRVLDRPPS